ncbi:Mrf1 mitochondrial respiratory protein [Candida orthopsilosis Co 90-125]|uniref:enoyl-[acyl-carrier-protein] reductase n=1 Tax=Candida orthopsilosis (strain 90-125) TaxID=1136231 RepID=H8WWL9_CANO9|nr:Mrf1 mitochondrial respiratory protein [Candida orthopsilosis Co 90-125]CCG20843.1 Mrf1 mitochondrial respiratory protein [Candida orthopsilosis Co 90-125]
MTIEGSAVTYTEYGSDIPKLLGTTDFKINPNDIKPDQVVIKALATPLNPADLMQLRGGYNASPEIQLGTEPNSPLHVGGNEGVYKVVKPGSNVSGFKEGDLVIPKLPSFGTWRSYAIADADNLIVVNGLSVDQAATISINPATAYQLLNNYVSDWQKGDYVIQNSGTSQVSRYVTQIAKLYGIKTISIVRDGKSKEEIDELKKFGAEHVISHSEFNDENFDIEKYTKGANVRLALNGSCDNTVANLVKSLSSKGQLISYGFLGGAEIKYSAQQQFAKDLVTRRYWLTANTVANPQGKVDTIKHLIELYHTGKIQDVPYNKLHYKQGGNEEISKVLLQGLSNFKGGKGKQVLFYE